MAGGGRMQAVRLRVADPRILRARVREEARHRVEVHHLHRPDVPRLLDRRHVVVEEETAPVRIRLVRLHVLRPERRIPPVDGREEDDPRLGEVLPQIGEREVDASPERARVEAERPLAQPNLGAVLVHRLLAEGVPVAERDAAIEVVRAREDEHDVRPLGKIGLGLLRLGDDMAHLLAVDAVDARREAVAFAEEPPVVRLTADVAFVRNRVPQEDDALLGSRTRHSGEEDTACKDGEMFHDACILPHPRRPTQRRELSRRCAALSG